MLESKLMFSHLTQNSADVQMNIGWIEHLEAVIDALSTEMKVIILDLKSFLEVAEGRSELFSTSENAGEVIVSYCSVFVSFFG